MNIIRRLYKIVTPSEHNKRVSSVKIKAVLEDATGEVYMTDVQVQGGARLSGYHTNTKEMLRKLREDGLPAAPKHFNAVIRGRKTIVIPNRGEHLKVALGAPVVTAPIDFTLWTKQAIAAGLQFSHFFRTRKFIYLGALAAGDKLEFLATTWLVKHNDVINRNYVGLFHQCPAGDSRFNVDLIEETFTERPQPSARLLVEIQEWEKDKGALRL